MRRGFPREYDVKGKKYIKLNHKELSGLTFKNNCQILHRRYDCMVEEFI